MDELKRTDKQVSSIPSNLFKHFPSSSLRLTSLGDHMYITHGLWEKEDLVAVGDSVYYIVTQ